MIEINSIKARTFSKLGQRGTIFAIATPELAEQFPEMLVLTADLALLSGLDRFIQKYPDRFYNMGISEQNMVGVAAGLAAEGWKPVVTTYSSFLSMRSCEQIRHFGGYMKSNILFVGSGAGFSMTYSGNTHYTVEDLAIMRAIPNMIVLSPSDAVCAIKAYEAALKYENPVYIRLSGGLNCPMVYKDDFDFEIGKAITLEKGADIQLIATGLMVSTALKVAELLKKEGHSVEVIDMHTIKPIDKSVIASKDRLIVTIEEHNVFGGLGGAVSEVMTEKGICTPLLRLGIPDTFLKVGDVEYLLDQAGLSVEKIISAIQNRL